MKAANTRRLTLKQITLFYTKLNNARENRVGSLYAKAEPEPTRSGYYCS